MIERVGREVVEQRRRRLARRPARQVPRVVLDPVTVPDLLDHLEIEHRPLMKPVRLEDLPFGLELRAVPAELRLDALDRRLGPIPRRHEVRLRVDGHLVVPAKRLARERIERDQLVDLVAEELDAQRRVLVGGLDLDDVAAYAEDAAGELVVVALVLDFDELPENLLALDPLAALERQHHPVVGFGRTEAVDA